MTEAVPSIWERLGALFGDVGGAMPESYGAKAPIADPLANAVLSAGRGILAPGQALQSTTPITTEQMIGPAMDTAGLAMTGGIGGTTGVPGVTLGSGPVRKPLIAGYHGTGSPAEFTEFKLPPPTHDLGIHVAVDPNVSNQYAYFKPSFNKSLSEFNQGESGVRVKPVLVDTQNALRFPYDAVKWNKPENVVTALKSAMKQGFVAPRGLLSDFVNIAGDTQTWRNQFTPMLQEKGYDSLWYPHGVDYSHLGSSKYNTLMALDPEQVMHRFSPRGQELAAQRGIKEPIQYDASFAQNIPRDAYGDPKAPTYTLPASVLAKPQAVETLRKIPKENTVPWWEDPDSFLSQVANAPPPPPKPSIDKMTAQSIAADNEMLSHLSSGKITQQEYLDYFTHKYGGGNSP